MKLEIVRRQFTKVNDAWVELEDLERRGLTANRSWSSFCAFIQSDNPEELATTLRKQVSPPHIDIVPSVTAGGVWVMGAHYQLEAVLQRLNLPVAA